MKKLTLIIFGALVLGSLSGCVGPAYHSGSYGGAYSSYYDYPYYYGFPPAGFYGSYYFSHRHHHHLFGDHKRVHHGFDQRKHFGKRFDDRSFGKDRYHGKSDNRSNWHSQRVRDGRSVSDEVPAVHRRTNIDDSRRAHNSGQQLRENKVTTEKSQRLLRPGTTFERGERQTGATGDTRRGNLKCSGPRC